LANKHGIHEGNEYRVHFGCWILRWGDIELESAANPHVGQCDSAGDGIDVRGLLGTGRIGNDPHSGCRGKAGSPLANRLGAAGLHADESIALVRCQ
jgi:hypothetical protein